MRRIRQIAIGAAVAVGAAALAGTAFGAPGHGRFAARGGFLQVQGGGGPGFFAGGGRFGMGGPGMGMPGGLGPGGFGRGPGGGILGADVLTPAASFLGISASTLESDLAGGKTLAQEATAKGKTPADLINAIVAAEKNVLEADKAAGWITADQETSILTGLTNQITELVDNGPAVPPSTPAGGAGGPLQAAATYLGISVSDLQTDLKSGKTLADVTGTVSGKSVDGLVAAMEAPAKTKLDAAVTAGKITQAQETAILDGMTTRLTDFVNGKLTGKQASTLRKSLRTYASSKLLALRK